MSILRGTFPNRAGNSQESEDQSSSGTGGQPDVLPGESVTAALARLRKFHRAEGEGIAISQPLNLGTPAENPSISRSGEDVSSFSEGSGSVWDVSDDFSDDEDYDAPPVPSRDGEALTAPVTPRRAGRVRTRLIGFEHSDGGIEDIAEPRSVVTTRAAETFPVGWLVVVSGEGRGHYFPLQGGVSQIGRGPDQAISLDFGDMAISREGHASIAYDVETNAFYLGHGGKQNIVRLNNRPVLGTETLKHGDLIRIGETTLRLAALCGDGFSWSGEQKAGGGTSE